MKEFTKDDLQVNDIVTTRENKTYMVHQFNTELIFVSKVAFLYLNGYTDDLIRKLNDGALDIIKYLMKPTGPFCPQLTLVVMLAGVLYGCFFYKKKLTIWRVLAAKFVVMLICNVILNTLCLQVLYGQALMAILPMRALKNLIMWPIDSIVFFGIAKALEQIGLFRTFRKPELVKNAQRVLYNAYR